MSVELGCVFPGPPISLCSQQYVIAPAASTVPAPVNLNAVPEGIV